MRQNKWKRLLAGVLAVTVIQPPIVPKAAGTILDNTPMTIDFDKIGQTQTTDWDFNQIHANYVQSNKKDTSNVIQSVVDAYNNRKDSSSSDDEWMKLNYQHSTGTSSSDDPWMESNTQHSTGTSSSDDPWYNSTYEQKQQYTTVVNKTETVMTYKIDLSDVKSILKTIAKATTSIDQKVSVIDSTLKEIDDKFGTKATAAVTQVYSVNNTIDGCYYKPHVDDVILLEEDIEHQGFANAYTGFFDLDYNTPNTDNHECRELEILGYDYLLQSEAYDGNNYNVSLVSGGVSKQTAVMDIYKAVGVEIQQIQYYFQPMDKAQLINSPAVKNLPWLINDIDSSRGITKAFITRTNPILYAQKAQKDLKMSTADVDPSKPITGEEFIILAAAVMDYYGEPVISNAEMNTLMQVFGGEIPSYLTSTGKAAYVYLRSRGIIASVDEMTYSTAISLDNMLTLLMRIKDTDSREDMKKIQITMSINDKLVNAGYFPKTVSIASGDNAIQAKTEYYYDSATVYDYYIAGSFNGVLRVPIDPTDLSSANLSTASYVGEEKIDGTTYHHMCMTAMASSASYFESVSKKYGVKNSYVVVDNSGKYFYLKSGGGVYTLSGEHDTNRKAFTSEFEGAVDLERSGTDTSLSASIKEAVSEMWETLTEPQVALAAANPNVTVADLTNTSLSNDALVSVTLYNAHNIDMSSLPTQISSQAAGLGDTLVIVARKQDVAYILASIKRTTNDVTDNPPVNGISNFYGDVLLPYSELVALGILYDTTGGVKPAPESYDSNILVLNSKNGRIILNNARREIIVGSNVYRVAGDAPLFQTTMDGTGNGELWIDFRAAYGWSANIANTIITGTADSFTIHIEPFAESQNYTYFFDRDIVLPESFKSASANNQGMVLPTGMTGTGLQYLTFSNYALANWVVYQGQLADYLFVFYPKYAFDSLGIEPPDDWALMESKLGYTVESHSRWVVRAFELPRMQNNTPGKLSYIEQFGYVYNLPEFNGYDMSKYLSGEYMLPLATNINKSVIFNVNVNAWSGIPYGTHPANNNRNATRVQSNVKIKKEVIDLFGNSEQIETKPGTIEIIAAPAGVASLFGGYHVPEIVLSDDTIKAAGGSTAGIYYYGTNEITVDWGSATNSGDIPNCKISMISSGFSENLSFSNSDKFRQTAMWYAGSRNNLTLNTRYIAYNALVVAAVSDDIPDDAKQIPEVINGDLGDLFADFDTFSFEYLLAQADYWTSFVIVFAFRVLPLVGSVLLTMLVGFSFLSTNKLFLWLVGKTFDPVKILTFGNLEIGQMTNKRKALIMLIVGLCGFALLSDGNIVRLLVFCGNAFKAFFSLLRAYL